MSKKEKDILPEEEIQQTAESAENAEDVTAEVMEEPAQEAAPDISAEYEAKLSEANDKYLRCAAEYDNFRRRSIKERTDAAQDASAKCISEFLTVIDNFERALNAPCSDDKYKDGVRMIFGQYNEILKKLGVEEIEALNQPFDPNIHNAVNQIQDESFPANTVCQVFQKGYRLGGKIVRHPMVVVANP